MMQPLDVREKLAIAALKSFPYYNFCFKLGGGVKNGVIIDAPVIVFGVPRYRPIHLLDAFRYRTANFVVRRLLRISQDVCRPNNEMPRLTQEQVDQCLALLNKFPDIFSVCLEFNGVGCHSFSVAVRSLPDELFQNARP